MGKLQDIRRGVLHFRLIGIECPIFKQDSNECGACMGPGQLESGLGNVRERSTNGFKSGANNWRYISALVPAEVEDKSGNTSSEELKEDLPQLFSHQGYMTRPAAIRCVL
ncbi:hypothetical protein MPER_08311 [Moniliophthora perniciosa FA553]|nr:hypothetical protein MPER_08311 [Moniliophthora perniciosa FA553]